MSSQVGFYEAWRDLLRGWGFAVHEVSGWQNRDAEPKTPYAPGKLYVEHHDGSSLLSGNWGALAYITANNLANVVTARDGQLMLNAAGVQWHAGIGGPKFDVARNLANPASLGNEVCNSGSEAYAPLCTLGIVAAEAAWAIVSGRQADYGRVIGHKEWATPPGRKVDPSINMDVRRQQVHDFIAGKTGQLPPLPTPPIVVPSIPALPGQPAWDLPSGHYFGNKAGPAASHGGFYPSERDNVQWIQRKFIALGCVAGQNDWRSSWADGLWEDATTAACRVFFSRFRNSQPIHTQIWKDDYAAMARL